MELRAQLSDSVMHHQSNSRGGCIINAIVTVTVTGQQNRNSFSMIPGLKVAYWHVSGL